MNSLSLRTVKQASLCDDGDGDMLRLVAASIRHEYESRGIRATQARIYHVARNLVQSSKTLK